MGIFDRWKKKTSNSEEDLITAAYRPRFFQECKWIWKQYVPESGAADCLQGELLREIEKLRYEAQNNGNRNWDDDFSFFCDFIAGALCKQSLFSDKEKEEVTFIMSYIKDCGNYAQKYNDGLIPQDEVDMNKIAHVDDNLYDRICDKIGQLQRKHPQPIPFERNSDVMR